jgi:hypothetical protein
MGMSRKTLGGMLLVVLLAGVGIGYGFRSTWESQPALSTATASSPIEEVDDVKLRQDGKEVTLAKFFSVFQENPNRFNMLTAKSEFYVEGRISKISEANDVIDKISGFYVPLRTPPPIEFEGLKGPRSVSLFVKGMTIEEISDLNAGDVLSADCPKVRVVNDGLVFDDCRLRKRKT